MFEGNVDRLQTSPSARTQLAALVLYVLPLVTVPLVGQRSLRESLASAIVGSLLFGVSFVAGLYLFKRVADRGCEREMRVASAGLLLVMPFAVIALAWIGLGTPWQATPGENQMRYLVLLSDAVLVTLGSGLLKEYFSPGANPVAATPAATLMLLAGAAYVVWFAWELGGWVQRARGIEWGPEWQPLNERFDVLLFAACALTYAGTILWILALRPIGWLGPASSWGLGGLTLIALVCLLLRGLAFPDPNSGAEPWYWRPGFIAGIPAMPWLVPHWLGVTVLRRAAGGLWPRVGVSATSEGASAMGTPTNA